VNPEIPGWINRLVVLFFTYHKNMGWHPRGSTHPHNHPGRLPLLPNGKAPAQVFFTWVLCRRPFPPRFIKPGCGAMRSCTNKPQHKRPQRLELFFILFSWLLLLSAFRPLPRVCRRLSDQGFGAWKIGERGSRKHKTFRKIVSLYIFKSNNRLADQYDMPRPAYKSTKPVQRLRFHVRALCADSKSRQDAGAPSVS
jgi:hypothetical protein